MGSYKEVKGDLLELAKSKQFDVIGHGANCFSTMGAGIAKQIKEKLSTAYRADVLDPRSPIQRLGDMSVSETGMGFIVCNLYTQFQPGPNFDYIAFELCLKKLAIVMEPKSRLGLPQIGCGIGGGDWDKVKKIIKRILFDFDVTIVIFE